ncbi:MAG: PEP-CTERM sorting domain-containing protein [Pirellulales bacterium]|nr:PEP-CTERM sorting domain-containing protein [Pirellulales bacterium]
MSLNRWSFLLMIPLLGIMGFRVDAADLTTFSNTNVEARYTTSLGIDYGDTIGNGGQGLYDYASDRGNGEPWWLMNNGDPYSNVNTYGGTTAEDFAGYQFKLPASITEINYSNRIYGDGGTFASTPRVEVLRNAPIKEGGVWEEIAVSWSAPYDNTFMNGHRQYTITPTMATGNVWGVRLIGAPQSGPAGDSGGWIGVGELQVSGDLPIANQIDLQNNLALNQPTIWSHTQWAEPWCLNDGNFESWSYETTWGGTDENDYFGVLLDSPKENVAAIGVTFKTFWDGGWFELDTMKVQYTTDGGTTWVDVTGLDMGRYPDDLDYLINVANWAEVAPFLWTFDPIDGVNGVRIYGPPGGINPDVEHFVGAEELEIFALVPEPASLALLILGGLALLVRRRR